MYHLIFKRSFKRLEKDYFQKYSIYVKHLFTQKRKFFHQFYRSS